MKTIFFLMLGVIIIMFIGSCVSVTTTPTPAPETPELKNLMDYPVQVRVATVGWKGDIEAEVWYGEELIWPENPYEMEGHWFILRPAVHPDIFGLPIVRDELEIKADDLIMIFKLKPKQDFEEQIKEFIWVNTHARETRDKRYCEIEVYKGAGLPLENRFEVYYSPVEMCSIQAERFNWGYGITTEFVHIPVAFLYDWYWDKPDKILGVGELWAQLDFGYTHVESPVKPGE